MPDKDWTYLVEVVPNSMNAETVEAFLQDAGSRGWELVAVVPKPEAHTWYHFKLEIGSAQGGRPKKLWS